jgi:hypothetical protein
VIRRALCVLAMIARRIDASPFDFSALSWVSAGFRFVSR